uniref:Tub domain-containing protein n=1 Tax=Mesocestoides corti TaxID=53468 RepID=A0A5K3EHQ7_MESCO
GDWTILRTGNSSLVVLQAYAALWIEVTPRLNMDHVTTPTLVVTLFTRADTIVTDSRTVEQKKTEFPKREGPGKLVAKTMILCSSSEGGQISDPEELNSLWPKIETHLKKIRSSTLGIIPLPLNGSHVKPTNCEALQCVCGAAQRQQPKRPVLTAASSVKETTAGSATVASPGNEDTTGVTQPGTTTSYISCEDTPSRQLPSVVNASFSKSSSASINDPFVADLTTPVLGTAKAEDIESTWTRSGTTESDLIPEGCTGINNFESTCCRLTAGLLSLSLNKAELVFSLNKASGAEKYLRAFEAQDDESPISCGHIECMGVFDPDFYQPPTGDWIERPKQSHVQLNATFNA